MGDGQKFHPCGYEKDTYNDAGEEIKITVNEVTDVANSIFKGKVPPTGLRFYGQKYMILDNTPKKEDDGRWLFLGKGAGSHIIISSTPQYAVSLGVVRAKDTLSQR